MTRTYTVSDLENMYFIFAPIPKDSLEKMKHNLVSYLHQGISSNYYTD